MNLWMHAVAMLLLSTFLSPEAQGATPADEIVAELNRLTKGHVYRGSRYAEGVLYDRETIRKVELEPSKGWLGVTVDDTQETAPVTVIIPLREVRVGAPSETTLSVSCGSRCIRTTSEGFAKALQKLAAAPGAKLNLEQRRDSIHFGCPADRCVAIRRAILKLAATVKPR